MITEQELSQKRMALFFTEGVSLRSWKQSGIFTREAAFYNRLSRYLGKICFLTYGDEEDSQYQEKLADNIQIFPVLGSNQRNGDRELLRDVLGKVDFLRTHQVKGAEAALRCKKERRLPLFVRSGYIWSLHHRLESHNPFSRWRVAVKEREVLKQCDAVLCASQMGMAHARRLCGDSEKPIGLIPNYVDTSLFKPLVVQKRKRSIIFVGRLVPQKNIFSLLRALEGIDCSLTVIGDGPLRESILFEASRRKIKLEYHEQIANEKLPDILNEHEIFILPSFYEGMPKALLEAMACGLAVVGSHIDGVKELIKDGVNGCLCRADSQSIHETVLKLFQWPSLIQQYGSQARESVELEFSLDRVIEKEVNFYKSVLQ
jgi:glycosyltransferase involved in cell wall biosynthesis